MPIKKRYEGRSEKLYHEDDIDMLKMEKEQKVNLTV